MKKVGVENKFIKSVIIALWESHTEGMKCAKKKRNVIFDLIVAI